MKFLKEGIKDIRTLAEQIYKDNIEQMRRLQKL